MEGGERGGEKKKPNKPTLPARRRHSPWRGTPGARTGAPPPLHAASAPSPQALSIFRPARPHAAPASAELQERPAADSRLGHAGPTVSAGSRGRHARATAGAPRADSRVPPGTRGSSSRPKLREHPALHPRPLPTRALHFTALTPPRDSAAVDEDTNRAQSGTRCCLPQVAAAPLRARPSLSTTQHPGARRLGPGQPTPRPCLARPPPCPAPSRSLVSSSPSDWLRNSGWAGPGGPEGRGAEEGALPASFVTSRRSDNPFHLARLAYWFHACARSVTTPRCWRRWVCARCEVDCFGWVAFGLPDEEAPGRDPASLCAWRLRSQLLPGGRAFPNAWHLCGAPRAALGWPEGQATSAPGCPG